MKARKQGDSGAGAEAGLAAEAPAPRIGGPRDGNTARRYTAAEKLALVDVRLELLSSRGTVSMTMPAGMSGVCKARSSGWAAGVDFVRGIRGRGQGVL